MSYTHVSTLEKEMLVHFIKKLMDIQTYKTLNMS